ncbi:hypothetical protein E3T28_01750 [Cryobacterium sinapicolor]|uniref:Uncharacterized protein n=1 Tax=Cryobacterium sinapicolor TaxID=1259236 RepID=A0ABY2JG98_9MICO|nr:MULTISPECIES: hypothetical protein [Cryobacterium]TFC91526.1 hypothetical protein E3O67_04210 [Cryobacterium sp. TMT3-29-2]TFD05066.1 hypothetical protein E3T28_01750 [Cryobacterium sinapicolor]
MTADRAIPQAMPCGSSSAPTAAPEGFEHRGPNGERDRGLPTRAPGMWTYDSTDAGITPQVGAEVFSV